MTATPFLAPCYRIETLSGPLFKSVPLAESEAQGYGEGMHVVESDGTGYRMYVTRLYPDRFMVSWGCLTNRVTLTAVHTYADEHGVIMARPATAEEAAEAGVKHHLTGHIRYGRVGVSPFGG